MWSCHEYLELIIFAGKKMMYTEDLVACIVQAMIW